METIIGIFGAFAKEHMYLHIILIAMATGLMLVAMGIDLVSGVRKARANGEATTSTGLKKTCEKARKYFGPYAVLACIDIITCAVIPFPVFSLTWAAYCVFCEYTSVREKSWKKAEIRNAEKTMNIVVENKEDIAKMVVELLTGKKDDSNIK